MLPGLVRSTIRRLSSLVRFTRKVWRENRAEQFLPSDLRVEGFRLGWMRTLRSPWFPESRMPNERCTSGLEGERQKLAAATLLSADARPLLSLHCWNGEAVQVLFSLDCCDGVAGDLRRSARPDERDPRASLQAPPRGAHRTRSRGCRRRPLLHYS
jgi:hypothetical protein